MSGKEDLRKRTLAGLKSSFGGRVDSKGYVAWPDETLVDGVKLEQFESDLRDGDGNELRMKFCALHSSAALAVNCFAYFKDHPGDLVLSGESNANSLAFERKIPIFKGGRAPNVDVWIDFNSRGVAIESKFTEYMKVTQPEFSNAYERLAPPALAEECWWNQQARQEGPQLLDRAQLVKHYFGLRKLIQTQGEPREITLLYLYWEPVNWEDFEVCQKHRKQIEQLSAAVKASSIHFQWMTYGHLWDEWSKHPSLLPHVENLRARYELAL